MSTVQKFATLGLAPAERLPFWKDVVDRVYTGTWVNTAKADFAAEMWRWKVGDLNMIRPRSDPAQIGRVADETATEEQVILHLQRRGNSCYRQDRREAHLAPGDFILLTTSRPYAIDLPTLHEMLIVQFPRRLIENRVRGLDDRLGTTISGAGASGRVFHDFLLSLWHQGDQSQADPDWQAGVGNVFADLTALAVNGTRGAQVAGSSRVRDRVLALVAARLGDPDLRTATIAGELGISPRTVQNVFAAMGTTPVGHVAVQRLERAAELLTSNPAISVTEIAYDLGFNDSAYFARCFRQHFGKTPSAYRATN
jgi:AraC-like DNA-binding protein